MPLIWCSISAHGYGHAAQVVPVLNALGRLVPDLRALLRTSVPASFFEPRLEIPWQLSLAQQDVGCIQNGPLSIDVPATWAAHQALHTDWDKKIDAEAALIRDAGPACVVSDVSHLGIAAGAAAGIPTIGLGSLSWDLVLSPFVDPAAPEHAVILDEIRKAYAKAVCFLRIAPGLEITAFRNRREVGPIAEPAGPQTARLRNAVEADAADRVVLVGFGGIPLHNPPFEQMEAMHGFRFLFDGPIPAGLTRITSRATVGLPFKQVLSSVDLVLTKPGYGTIVEAVALGIPVVYVRRYNFADEQSLVDYLHRHGRGAELTRADFHRGQWIPTIRQALAQSPPSPPPSLSGAQEAADVLSTYL